MEEDDKNNEETIATYHPVNLQKLEESTNSLLVCSCSVDEKIMNFIDFCVDNDPDMYPQQMKR